LRPYLAPPPLETGMAPGQVPTFSVIIAAYQAVDFVSVAIGSALDQTVSPLEVVVCDDGSDDDTVDAVKSYGERVTLVRREHGGEGAAKNSAARAAKGDFVVILDADDRWLAERLEALGELGAARPDLDILTTDAWIEADARRIRRAYNEGWRFAAENQRLAILERNFVFGHAAVRRETLLRAGGFDESISRTTDWDCWLRMIYAGSRVGLVDEPLAIYRLHGDALSGHRSGMLRGAIQTLEKARCLDLTPVERRTLEATIAERRRRARREEAREALGVDPRRARRLAWGIARDRVFDRRTRAKAALTAAAPVLAGRLINLGRGSRGAGDLVIDGD
jgi:glycosyltransferase involved in cell wall biosynthesis